MVEDDKKATQVMVDKVFSFAELGFQEFETSKYLTSILEENGFEIEYAISDIPTAWLASWSNGEGGPTIALGSDIDGIPVASQYPGVAYHKPMVEGAPGHGEGHNSGLPVVITAALSVKKIMQENNIAGKLVLWPGVAEEQIGTKAWYVRDGYFDDVDIEGDIELALTRPQREQRRHEHTDHSRGGEVHDQLRGRKPPAHDRAGVTEGELCSAAPECQCADQGSKCHPNEDRRPEYPQRAVIDLSGVRRHACTV